MWLDGCCFYTQKKKHEELIFDDKGGCDDC